MSIFDQTRLGELYRLIKRDNPSLLLDLTEENVTVSGFAAVNMNNRNTTAVVSGVKYSGYRGKKTVYYNRIDLPTLVKNIDVKVVVTPDVVKDLDSILPFVNAKLGIYLEPGDYPNSALTANPETMRFEGTFTIAANHPIYKGSLSVEVWGYTVSLEDVVITRDLETLKDYSPHVGGKHNPSTLTYGHDYTDLQDLWSDWTPGSIAVDTTLADIPARNLAVALAAVDGLPWTYSTASKEFNLRGAKVLYDGPPQPKWAGSASNPEPNYAYDRVLIIQPNATYCPNLAIGNGWGLIIHYDLITE